MVKISLTKTQEEIKLLEKACEISNSCIPLIEKSLKENITEKELRRRIEKKIRSQHATLSFGTLIACGRRSAQIHANPRATNKKIKGIGYADFGASYKGYKSDVTVPFIKGKISRKEKKIVDTVLKSYNIAASSIRVGMPCWMLFKKVDDFLSKNGFKVLHPIGHGVGLKIHELPYILMPRKKRLSKKKMRRWEKLKKIVFLPNMVFTIEPAVYAKGIGGCRIENDFLLTKKGAKVLTNSRLIKV